MAGSQELLWGRMLVQGLAELLVQSQSSAEPERLLAEGNKAFPPRSGTLLPAEGSTAYFRARSPFQKDHARKGGRAPPETYLQPENSGVGLAAFSVESKGRKVDGRAWRGTGLL